jgi:FkbM family methyltransferase
VKNEFLKYVYYHYNEFVFEVCDMLQTIEQVVNEYRFDDIRKSDIVLDVGSCIGAFSIFASKRAKMIYSVEPVYNDILKKNIEANNIKNIKVLAYGLGDGIKTIKFGRCQKEALCLPLSEIIDICDGHVDFMKCDCEGAEWIIRPEELKGIRRIEIEVHEIGKKYTIKKFIQMLERSGYYVDTTILTPTTAILHANLLGEVVDQTK